MEIKLARRLSGAVLLAYGIYALINAIQTGYSTNHTLTTLESIYVTLFFACIFLVFAISIGQIANVYVIDIYSACLSLYVTLLIVSLIMPAGFQSKLPVNITKLNVILILGIINVIADLLVLYTNQNQYVKRGSRNKSSKAQEILDQIVCDINNKKF